jgi:hypothetical protein
MKESIMQKIQKITTSLEFWDGNTYYGIGNILKNYAKLPFFIPLNFRIQHGIDFFALYPSVKNYRCSLDFYVPADDECLFLMYSKIHADYLQRNGIMNVKAIGAPFIYLDAYIHSKKTQKRRGTIVFPQHSTQNTDIYSNFDEYAEMLLKLPERYHPIRICMYYLDVQKGYSKPFLDRGFEVVCNGDLHSQNFLYRFIDNTIDFEYVSSNYLGFFSAPYYAIYLGLKYFEYGPKVQYRFESTEEQKNYSNDYILYINLRPYEFPIEQVEDYERQKRIAYDELGVASRLSKAEMRKLLLSGMKRKFVAKYLKFFFSRVMKSG